MSVSRRARVLLFVLGSLVVVVALLASRDLFDVVLSAPSAVRLTNFEPGAKAAPKPSSGCAASPAGGSARANTSSITADGVVRTYELALPASYDPRRPYPLILGFHGSGGDGASFHRTFDAEKLSGDGVIAVYPNAVVRRVWGEHFATHWGKSEDLPLVDALVSRLKETLCIDENRVFAVGWSSGGYFANQLGCVRPETFRAIAALSGGGPENVTCTHPMTAFLHHDRNDGSVAFATGRESREHWRSNNHCSGTKQSEDGCTTYDGCSAPVVWCETAGNGHGVPSSVKGAAWTFLSAL